MDTNDNRVQTIKDEKIRRNKLIKIMLFLVIIYLIIVFSYTYIQASTQDDLTETYQKNVEEYLKEKYPEDFENFEIEFYNKETNYEQKDGSISYSCYWGKKKCVEEYIYHFYPKDNDYIRNCFVVYWHNTEDNSSGVYEKNLQGVLDKNGNSVASLSYSHSVSAYNAKLDLKDSIEDYLGDEYTIKLFEDPGNIIAETDKTIEEVALSDIEKYTEFYNNLAELFDNYYKENKYSYDISLEINYKNMHVTINNLSQPKTVEEMKDSILNNTDYHMHRL